MNPFIAEIKLFGGNFAPRGWAFCEGQLMAISSNTALFSLLGTTYGGDGRTTFALPDMRGRATIHWGRGPGLSSYRLGQMGGTEENTLNITQLPSHNHSAVGTVKAAGVPGDQRVPTGRNLAGSTGDFQYSDTAANVSMAANNVTVTTASTGGNQSVNNLQPFISVSYIIALQGLYPSRN